MILSDTSDTFIRKLLQVQKEQAKNSNLKGDVKNMEAVLEWESYFGQVMKYYDIIQEI